MLRLRSIGLASLLVLGLAALGCVSSEPEKTPKQESKPKPKPAPEPPAAAPSPAQPVAAVASKDPEPTTPEEIELARKAALMEGRDKDALKYCGMAGIEAGKSDEQALLGCALAACRGKDMDKARGWAKGLGKDLLKQAKAICRANGAPL